MRIILLILLITNALTTHAQSKKDLQQQLDELQKSNLQLEKSNAVLNTKVENLSARITQLEKALETSQQSEQNAEAARDNAILAKDEATKAKEAALQAQIKAMNAEKVAIEEKQRMEDIFNKEVKGKSSLRQKSIVGRYFLEKDLSGKEGYIDLFEDGTLLLKGPESEKNPLLSSITGTYKLNGNRITLIVTLFTMSNAIDGTIEGNRLVLIDNGKKNIYIREK
jgi:hypothetical protein